MSQIENPNLASLKAMASASYAEQLNDAQKRLEISVGYAQASLKALFLVNGGSIVALLTFIGNGGKTFDTAAIFWAFTWFAAGLTAVLVAHFAAYFSQAYYMQVAINEAWNAQASLHGFQRKESGQADRTKGDLAMKVAIIGTVASLVLFVVGTFVALDAIT